jgi:hypothetical protein
MKISLGELRRLIRETIEESMGSPTIFGPPGAPIKPGRMSNERSNTGHKELEPSIVYFKGVDAVTGKGWRGKREFLKQGHTLAWKWNPDKVRTLTEKEYQEAKVLGIRELRSNDPALERSESARMTRGPDGRVQLYGQWVEMPFEGEEARFAPPVRGEVPPLVSRAASERMAARQAAVRDAAPPTVVRRRRDEETGAVTSITPVRGNRR